MASNPAITQGFQNLADVFGPPSARDLYYGAEGANVRVKAAAEQAKAQRLSDLWTARDTMSPQEFDRATAAIGLNPVTQGYAKLDVDKRGQDIVSSDNRFRTTTEAGTSRANNADTNERELIAAISSPTPEGATRVIPPSVATRLGVPGQQTGIVKLNPGQTATLPGAPIPAGTGSIADAVVPPPTVLQGNPKPLTDAEAKGKIIQEEMTPEERHALGISEIKQGPVFQTPGGTAYQDPVTKQIVGTQDKAPVPVGTQATNLGAPHTTVNVGPNGEQFGAPPKDMAWAREADGKTVKVDARGAPMAVPIGGAPWEEKQKADAAKKLLGDTQRKASSDVVTQDIDRAIAAIDSDPATTSGLIGQATSAIGGTPAADVDGLLASVKANVAFDRLQQMRQSSPTGGALGNVSDKEGELLQSSLGSLKQSQGPTQLKENLKRVKDISLDIIHGGKTNGQPTAGPARSYEQTATNPQTKERQVLRNGQWVPE